MNQTTAGARLAQWSRRFLAFGALATVLYLARAPILTAFAMPLIAGTGTGRADLAVLLNGDRIFEQAGTLMRTDTVESILWIERRPNRLESLAVVPSAETTVRTALEANGVVPAELTVLPSSVTDDFEWAEALAGWLATHSPKRVLILCDRFSSRRLRIILAMAGVDAERVRLLPLPHRAYSEADWWRSEEGVLAFARGYAQLAYVSLNGCGNQQIDWDADAYEARLIAEGGGRR